MAKKKTASPRETLDSVLAEIKAKLPAQEAKVNASLIEQEKRGKRLPDYMTRAELRAKLIELERRIVDLERAARTPRTRDELAASANSWQGWPADRPARYNGSGTPCDMFIGPCSCGAMHHGK